MMADNFEHETQREAVGEATAQRNFAVGFLKGNSLSPRKNVVIPPYSVETLVENHVPVRVERKLGKGADFIDLDYADAGAILEDTPEFIFKKSDIVVCLRPLSCDELVQLKDNQILITPVAPEEITAEHLTVLQIKHITALSLRMIQNVENDELLQDILEVEGGMYVASNALGDLTVSLILPLIFNSHLRHALQANPVLLQAIYCYRGTLTREDVSERTETPWCDLLSLCM